MTDRTDTFNRADATSLGTPSDGGSSWVETTGTDWQIQTNRVFYNNNTASNVIVVLESSITAVTVQCTFSVLPNSPNNAEQALSIRVVDSSNYWRMKFRSGAGASIDLQKIVAGSFTIVATVSMSPTAGDVMSVEVTSADAWNVKQNGSSILTATDSAVNTGTLHGLNANYNSGPDAMRWDSFSITALGAAATVTYPQLERFGHRGAFRGMLH